MHEQPNPPKVSLALPVYNGERYLRSAIEAILAQTYADFELVISDNASTDATERIARELAAGDPRIRYVRLPTNIGAAPNFNRAYEECRGEYFKWAAHDDLLEPTFLAKCVAALDADESVVLAYPKSMIIDGEGNEVEEYLLRLPTDAEDPVERFGCLLKGGHKCFEIFGLIRRSALENTGLMGAYTHGDGVLLARLALVGPFVEIPELLFFPRRHDQQSMALLNETEGQKAAADYRSYAVWFDSKLKGKRLFPTWRMGLEFFKSFVFGPVSWMARLRCLGPFLRWVWIYRRTLRGDVTFHARRMLRRA